MSSPSDVEAAHVEVQPVAFRIRLGAVAAMVTVNTLVYLAINAHPTRSPSLLPMTWLDEALGRHAWTIWPYWLLLVINPFLAVAIREQRILLATLRAYVIAMGLNIAVWGVAHAHRARCDTRWHRGGHPRRVAIALRAGRTQHLLPFRPHHDSMCRHGRLPRAVPGGKALDLDGGVAVPTIVTTGQHYAIDLFAGMATAFAGIALAGRPLLERRRLAIA
jgi:hypothetical protein